MGATNVNGAGNGQVPGFQAGGSLTQTKIDQMSNGDLFSFMQSGSGQDKKNVAAEILERFNLTSKARGADNGEKSEHGLVNGGFLAILGKLMRGERLTPAEEEAFKKSFEGDLDLVSGSSSPGSSKI